MTIPINYDRLHRAVFEVNKHYKLTTADGRYSNRLRARYARDIAERMNEMRERGIMWHSALVHAAAAQKGIGNSRRALYRKAMALYGWWTRKAMMKAGIPLSEFYGTRRVGDDLRIETAVNERTGQYGFLT